MKAPFGYFSPRRLQKRGFFIFPVYAESGVVCFASFHQPPASMADAETLLMETMDQNGDEDEGGQDDIEQELMMGEEDQGDDADGGKIEATKGDEDTG